MKVRVNVADDHGWNWESEDLGEAICQVHEKIKPEKGCIKEISVKVEVEAQKSATQKVVDVIRKIAGTKRGKRNNK